MRKNGFLLPTLLTAVLFVALMAELLVQVWLPTANLPPLNVPNMVVLSVAALLLERLFVGRGARHYLVIFVFGALAFGVLPLMAGVTCVHTCLDVGAVGGVVFTAATFLFTTTARRLDSGKKAALAPLMLGVGLILASQCFAGIVL